MKEIGSFMSHIEKIRTDFTIKLISGCFPSPDGEKPPTKESLLREGEVFMGELKKNGYPTHTVKTSMRVAHDI